MFCLICALGVFLIRMQNRYQFRNIRLVNQHSRKFVYVYVIQESKVICINTYFFYQKIITIVISYVEYFIIQRVLGTSHYEGFTLFCIDINHHNVVYINYVTAFTWWTAAYTAPTQAATFYKVLVSMCLYSGNDD